MTKTVDMPKLAKEIAEKLSWLKPGHKIVPLAEPGDHFFYLLIDGATKDNGRRISVWYENRSDKLMIKGRKPVTKKNEERPYSHEDWCETIGVSASKSADQIARDICRRLWQDYMDRYEAAWRLVLDADVRYDRQQRAMDELAKIVGGKRTDGNEINVPSVPATGYFHLLRTNGDDVDMDMRSIPMELGKKILALYAEHVNKNK